LLKRLVEPHVPRTVKNNLQRLRIGPLLHRFPAKVSLRNIALKHDHKLVKSCPDLFEGRIIPQLGKALFRSQACLTSDKDDDPRDPELTRPCQQPEENATADKAGGPREEHGSTNVPLDWPAAPYSSAFWALTRKGAHESWAGAQPWLGCKASCNRHHNQSKRCDREGCPEQCTLRGQQPQHPCRPGEQRCREGQRRQEHRRTECVGTGRV